MTVTQFEYTQEEQTQPSCSVLSVLALGQRSPKGDVTGTEPKREIRLSLPSRSRARGMGGGKMSPTAMGPSRARSSAVYSTHRPDHLHSLWPMLPLQKLQVRPRPSDTPFHIRTLLVKKRSSPHHLYVLGSFTFFPPLLPLDPTLSPVSL